MSVASLRRVHGDRDHAELSELGLVNARLLDFSVNLSPHGPAPFVLEAIRDADPISYPDATGAPTREKVGAWLGVGADEVTLGPGAAELLWSIARAFLSPEDEAFVVGPTFSEFGAAAVAAGARVHTYMAREDLGFEVDLDVVAQRVRKRRPKLVYVCNPNNPTGRLIAPSGLFAFAEVLGELGATLVVDEAFLTLSTGYASLRDRAPDNVIRVRSLTKDHAIAGVRAAYAVASTELSLTLAGARPPWATSAHALAAIEAVCTPEGDAHVARAREDALRWRGMLDKALERIRARPLPSDTLYVLAKVSDTKTLRRRLLRERRILVRDCASFGLPDHVRLCARRPDEVTRLVESMASIGWD